MSTAPVLRTATAGDEPALHALWSTCFGPPAAHLPALYALDPDRHRRTFLATGAGETVDAVVVLVPRLVRGPDGTPEHVGGIGSVATHPAARGRGLVRALLGEAVRAMEAAGYAWSLLFTGTPGVYEGTGWRTFPRPYAEGALAPPTYGRTSRVREATDTDGLPALHEAAHATRPLTAVRTEADWRVRVPAWHRRGTVRLVADDPATGAPAGYAVATYDGAARTVQLREFGVRPGADPACLADLFAAHATAAHEAGLTHARTPLTPEAASALAHLIRHPTRRTDHTGMAHPLRSSTPLLTPLAPGATHWHGDSF